MAVFTRAAVLSLLFLAFSSPVFCQQETAARELKTVVGEVVAVDWVASALTVRHFDDRIGRGFDEINFIVTHDTVITKGTETVGLFDINQSDQVTVEYYDDSFSGLKAAKIVVES